MNECFSVAFSTRLECSGIIHIGHYCQGKSAVLEHTPIETVFTDACDEAAGGVFGGDWFHFSWSHDWPKARTLNINEKEVIAVAIAAHRWAPYWIN